MQDFFYTGVATFTAVTDLNSSFITLIFCLSLLYVLITGIGQQLHRSDVELITGCKDRFFSLFSRGCINQWCVYQWYWSQMVLISHCIDHWWCCSVVALIIDCACVSQRLERRRPARDNICPLESKFLRTDGEDVAFKLDSRSPSTPHAGSSTGDKQEEERTLVSGK